MAILSLLRQHSWVLVLLFAPAAVILHAVAPDRHTTVFFLCTIAIMPLAGYIGHATEQLAERLGGGIGGLMNATFGNATELIIGAFALHEGLYPTGQGLDHGVDSRKHPARLRPVCARRWHRP